MNFSKRFSIFIVILLFGANQLYSQEMRDSFLWLEEITSKRALDWVETHNKISLNGLQKFSAFDSIFNISLEAHSPELSFYTYDWHNHYLYTVNRDSLNEKGIWQRTSLKSYLDSRPAWEKLLDLDSLSEVESENWHFRGAEFATPTSTRCIISLLPLGSGKSVGREFDVQQKAFVKNGFYIPAGREVYTWRDENSFYVSISASEDTIGKGQFNKIYKRQIVKLWKRGTLLEDSEIVFKDTIEADVYAAVDHRPEGSYHMIVQWLDFKRNNFYVLEQGNYIKLELPDDAFFRFVKGQLVASLQSDWRVGNRTYTGGSVIGIDYNDFLKGDRNFTVIFNPDSCTYFWDMSSTKSCLLIMMLRNAIPEVYRFRFDSGKWLTDRITVQEFSSTYVSKCNVLSDTFFISYSNFLEPATTCLVRENGTIKQIERNPSYFDSDPFIIHQYETLSKDDTRIPYFIVHHRRMILDGSNPTILTAYGAVGESVTPYYDPIIGSAWLEKGGIYVLANIRGGGELGQEWHHAAQGKNKQLTFDDFFAVAEDLIARGITSPRHLGIMGRSAGGLLVGAVSIQRPDLFNAVACLNPVLDMKRFFISKEEYGDPDNPDDWSYMKEYSPYHNVSHNTAYPRILFVTSRDDQVVPPWHARKMAAKMEKMGHEVLFYETEEGGHASAVTSLQKAHRDALIYSYLWQQLR